MADSIPTLTPQHLSMIQQVLATGDYDDASAVVTAALEQLTASLIMGQIGERGQEEFAAKQGTWLKSPDDIKAFMANTRQRCITSHNG